MAECDSCYYNVQWAEDVPKSEQPKNFESILDVYRCINPECSLYKKWVKYDK